ncbi:sulfur carrier protein ThiS adenylyltransferase ThiF [Tepidibacter hydrothermalis]|uniref:Sulfur carrier protein ThiS adenylyltransferase ThiF n=1 Tax=Tepidibacter hydrothermalis TaxID=3036126 RepID=A0ABY8E9D6_9FIRM|nr:sulfur carrier protein ThiS adenylyltransferase ThiF [Tepidibacter hydrothermalis]WFD09521.1 sulfur carrier protein ThiS adenylyltransferase ThiF [Tepidibacter hydrothermalis]
MKIYVNKKKHDIKSNATAYNVRDSIKKDADVIILNGFIINKDTKLNESDDITLIKKGEQPSKEELEHLLVSRHTPNVHGKIKKAKVAIAGLGGLGSNIAVSLARIGIGKLLLFDFDVVEPSNLNRQQYFIKHIGMRKTDAIKDIIHQCNPFVDVYTQNIFIDKNNIKDTFKDVEIIVEAFDNPNSKATLVNTILSEMPEKKIVAASGLAGYFSSNSIITQKIKDNLYIVGDNKSESKPGCGLMAPRVGIAANHQANMVLRLILDEQEI